MEWFTIFLCATLLTYGVSVFNPERTIVVISGICAIVAGLILIVRGL